MADLKSDSSSYIALLKKRSEALISHKREFKEYASLRGRYEGRLSLIKTCEPSLQVKLNELRGEADRFNKQMEEACNRSINLLKAWCRLDEQIRGLEIQYNFKDPQTMLPALPPPKTFVPDKGHDENPLYEAMGMGLLGIDGD